MKLKEVVPSEQAIISLPVESLGKHLLTCLNAQSDSSIRRRGLAVALLRDYPREYVPQSLYAIEEALIWLEHQSFIGLDPSEREFVFITRSGKSAMSSEMDVLEHSTNR